jgi:RNA polymerase sigma-70 factor (ECF subfamily)
MSVERGPVSTAVRRTMERRSELLAYARAIVTDWSLAEDVFQEALVVAIEKGPDLPDEATFGRWMREVIRRIALDALGRRQRAPRLMDPQLLEILEPAWERQEGRWGSDLRQALRRCMEKLTDRARLLLRERYEGRLTGSRLAERVGLTINSAYATLTRLHRVLEDCTRKSLQEQEGRV